jgi:hypothetical protein
VHEFLVKPVSGKALYERLASVLLNPRPMVTRGEYYVPAPRKMPRATSDFQNPERHGDPRMRAEGQVPGKPEVDRSAANMVILE